MIEDLNVYVTIDFYDRPYNINIVYSRADCFLLVNIVVDNKRYPAHDRVRMWRAAAAADDVRRYKYNILSLISSTTSDIIL